VSYGAARHSDPPKPENNLQHCRGFATWSRSNPKHKPRFLEKWKQAKKSVKIVLRKEVVVPTKSLFPENPDKSWSTQSVAFGWISTTHSGVGADRLLQETPVENGKLVKFDSVGSILKKNNKFIPTKLLS